LEEKHKKEVSEKVKDVQTKLEKTIESQDNQLQEGANKLYGANEAFKFYKNPERLDLIINNRVTEAQAAIGKQPTYKAVQEENERLKKELDEKLTSLDDLRKKHNEVIAENVKLSEATSTAKKEVEIAKAEWLKIEQKYISDSTLLQSKLKEANDRIIQMEKEYKHHVADKTSDNLINHIQDMKENPNISDDVKKMLKESLTQWNSKYIDGKSTTTDISVENYIKSKLKTHGRL